MAPMPIHSITIEERQPQKGPFETTKKPMILLQKVIKVIKQTTKTWSKRFDLPAPPYLP